MKLKNLVFNIVFDNFLYDENLKSLWGFSCLVEIKRKKVLFDTGSNGRVLLSNIKKMNLDLKDISTLFISHPHWDHIGGLDTVLEENPDIKLVIPKSFSYRLIEDLKNLVKELIIVDKHPLQIDNGIYSTGTLGEIGEESMIIDTEDGGVLVVGCSHPGIVNIIKRATMILNKNIVYVIGGFHLLDKNEEDLEKIVEEIKSLGVKYITPTHCSGERAIELFQKRFKERFLPGGVARVIDFKKL